MLRAGRVDPCGKRGGQKPKTTSGDRGWQQLGMLRPEGDGLPLPPVSPRLVAAGAEALGSKDVLAKAYRRSHMARHRRRPMVFAMLSAMAITITLGDDRFVSTIHTAEDCPAPLPRHINNVAENPSQGMPWIYYRKTFTRIAPAVGPTPLTSSSWLSRPRAGTPIPRSGARVLGRRRTAAQETGSARQLTACSRTSRSCPPCPPGSSR